MRLLRAENINLKTVSSSGVENKKGLLQQMFV